MSRSRQPRRQYNDGFKGIAAKECDTLFVTVNRSRFPNHINSGHLRDHFVEFEDDIVNAMIVRDMTTKKSKGFGFIKFTSASVATNAMSKLQESKLHDKFTLFIGYRTDPKHSKGGSSSKQTTVSRSGHVYKDTEREYDDSFDSQSTASESDSESVECHSATSSTVPESSALFVCPVQSKFPEYVQSGHLERHFRAEFGDDVLSAYIARDMKTRRTKGFGRVNFSSAASAKQAKTQLNGSLLLGKIKLKIEFQRNSRSRRSSRQSEFQSRSSVQAPLVQEELFCCKPEQTLFLRHCFFESPTPQAQLLRKSLPAKLIDKAARIHLSGNRVEIDSSFQMLNRFLSGLKHCTVSYSFHTDAFASILKKHFIPAPDKECVTCVLQETLPPPGTLTVHIFSVDFNKADQTAKQFKKLQAQSKVFCLPPESSTVDGIEECIESISNGHRTLVERRGLQSLNICGFSMEDILATWKEIKSKVDSKIVMSVIHIHAYQLKYLKAIHASDFSEVQELIESELVLPDLSFPLERELQLKLRGKLSHVSRVLERLKTVKSRCKIEKASVQCPKIHLPIWKNRWDVFAADKINESNIFVEYATYSSNPFVQDVTVNFILYSESVHAIREAKLAIIKYENGRSTRTRQLQLSDEQFNELTTCLPKLRDDLFQTSSVYLECDVTKREANFVVPRNSTVNLLEIEEKLKRELSPKSTVKSITVRDKVVGNSLRIEFMQKHYLRNVEVKAQNTGPNLVISLEGTPKNVVDGKQRFKRYIKLFRSGKISTKRVSMPLKHVPILSSVQFTSFISTFQEKFGVACYFPTSKAEITQIEVPSSVGSMCTVQLCRGNIFEEEVDAVIAPTNSRLSTTAFRATSDIARAAGPNILEGACSEFLLENTKPCLGDVVEVDCGNLPFQSLVLAVIERGNDEAVTQAVQNVFQLAYESKFGSLSFPSIMTKEVLDTIGSTTVVPSSSDSTIHTIRIIVPPNEPSSSPSTVIKRYQERISTANESIVEVTASQSSSSLNALTRKLNSASLQPHLDVSPKPTWMWQDDRRQFVQYDQEICDKLTRKWKEDPSGSTFVRINKTFYAIDFGSNTQKNFSTGHTRKIKCIFESSKDQYAPSYRSSSSQYLPVAAVNSSVVAREQTHSIQWLYKNDASVYTLYSQNDSDLIELMYSGHSASQVIQIGKWKYTFDFQDMKQVNTRTGTRRNIKRKLSPSEDVVHVPRVQIPIVPEQQSYIGLRGLTANMEAATKAITSQLQSLSITKSVSLPSQLTTDSVFQDTLENIIKKHGNVHIHKASEASASGNKENILVEGEEQMVLSAFTEIQSVIIHHHTGASEEAPLYPQEWVPQEKVCQMFRVAEGSSEWIKISSQFKETMHGNEIISIKRVQNKWLWERYQRDKKRMQTKNKGLVNEMDLFHGSRKVSAEKIIQSEEGFDMRFSSEGMWGQANYFAVKARYSDTYAYHYPASQRKELLVAKVLTGDSITLPSDKTLRMPPEKEQTESKSSLMPNEVRYRYDTVNGTTHGCKVYMTYSNDKAYPAYVITYHKVQSRVVSPSTLRTRFGMYGLSY